MYYTYEKSNTSIYCIFGNMFGMFIAENSRISKKSCIFAHDMELRQNSIIVCDRIEALFDLKLSNYFTHVLVSDGKCAMNKIV